MADHAIEAAAMVIANALGDDFHSLSSSSREWYVERARNAIAAYEAALWRPVSEHNGSATPVMLEYETPHGELRQEPAWYETDVMQRGWWQVNLDWSDDYTQTFEAGGCIPRRFRPLPISPKEGV